MKDYNRGKFVIIVFLYSYNVINNIWGEKAIKRKMIN